MKIRKFLEENRITLIFNEISEKNQDFLIDYTKVAYDKGCKIIKDDNLCIIEFENHNEDVNDYIEELLTLATSDDDEIEDIIVQGLDVPIVKQTNKISVIDKIEKKQTLINTILPDGPFKGQSAANVLNTNGYPAIVELMRNNNYPSNVQYGIVYCVKRYVTTMKTDKEYISKLTIDEIKNFIKCFEKFLSTKISDILSKAGYIDLDIFLSNATDFQLRSAYSAIAKELKNKFNA